MRILSLQGTFGGLDNRRVEFNKNMNIVCANNETGKSTIAAFIYAMLYGIDTRARSSEGYIPDKEKYQPWNSGKMYGTMTVEFNGREIVLERKTIKGPMREFSATYADTGDEVAGINGTNAGEFLLGIDGETFLRTAYLKQTESHVSASSSLEKRISSIQDGGDERYSAIVAQDKLRQWKNRVSEKSPEYKKCLGEISEVTRKIEYVDEKLCNIHSAEKEVGEISRELDALKLELKAIRYKISLDKKEELKNDEQVIKRKEEELVRRREELFKNGEFNQLKLSNLEGDCRVAAHNLLFERNAGVKPMPPESRETLELVEREYVKAVSFKSKFAPFIIIAALLALLAVIGFVLVPVLGLIFIPSLVFAVLAYTEKVKENGNKKDALTLLSSVDAQSIDEVRKKIEENRAKEIEYKAALLAYEKAVEDDENRKLDAKRSADKVCREVYCVLGTPVIDIQSAEHLIESAKIELNSINLLTNEIQKLRAVYEEKSKGIEDCEKVDVPLSGRSEEELSTEISEMEARLHALEREVARAKGEISSFGSRELLLAQKDNLLNLQKKYELFSQAISMASDAVSKADEEQKAKFSPELNRRAGEIMHKITDGRYKKVALRRDFKTTVSESESNMSHTGLEVSIGTRDQMYFALRMALLDMIEEEGFSIPVILDDAFAYYDDDRVRSALEFLSGLDRQVIVFTCHSREAEIMGDRACTVSI